mgnify:CR=1 FL=1
MTKIVLDVDTGIDDALALAYLLASPEAELLGMVGTYGNVLADTAVRNNHELLRLFGRPQVPVMSGAICPSWAPGFAVDEGCARFHGSNGLGNVRPADYMGDGRHGDVAGNVAKDGVVSADGGAASAAVDGVESVAQTAEGTAESNAQTKSDDNDPHAAAVPMPSETIISVGGYPMSYAEAARRQLPISWRSAAAPPAEGVQFIIDVVRRYGKDVIIVATGPMTDLDEATRLAPDIVPRLHAVIMGGALTQEGNCYDLVCETNIIQDPEAADRLFRSGADITMIGLDVTHQCLLSRADTEAWRSADPAGSHRGAFLADMLRFYIAANEASDPIFASGSPLHDPLAVAVALDPTLVKTFPINMKVELVTGDGHGVRGRTIGDAARLRDPQKSMRVALGVDANRFIARIQDRLIRLCANR